MRRLLAILLCCALLSGCTAPYTVPTQATVSRTPAETTVPVTEPEITESQTAAQPAQDLDFVDIQDPGALDALEEQIYTELVLQLDSTEYFVENVEAIYISDEYLEELEFNSQANIFFGYTLEQLNEFYEGQRYIFTLGQDGQTVVQEFVNAENSYDQIVKNLAVGAGVIVVSAVVVCLIGPEPVTLSNIMTCAVSIGKAPAAKFFGSMFKTIVVNRSAEHFGQIVQEAALESSSSFAWSAFTGSLKSAGKATLSLLGRESNGLTNSQSARIQQESTLPLDFIKNFHSVEEYEVYRDAGLQGQKVDGQWAYVRDIDWSFLDSQGRTNAQRVLEGLSPLDPEGNSYELHHIGQRTDSPLAILTSREHEENFSALHANTGASEGEQPSQGSEWTQQRRNFWRALLDMYLAEAA